MSLPPDFCELFCRCLLLCVLAERRCEEGCVLSSTIDLSVCHLLSLLADLLRAHALYVATECVSGRREFS